MSGSNEPVTTGIRTVTSNVRQLSDGNGLHGGPGTALGISALDLVGFFGATPVQQPGGPTEAAVSAAAADGSVAVINTTATSVTLTAPNTTGEHAITPIGATATWRVTSGDVVLVNMPTVTAGLGIGNVRVSSTGTLGVTFSNFTAATLTPTASMSYAAAAVRGFGNLTGTLSPAAVGPTVIQEQTFAVPGLPAGALVAVSKPTAQAGLDIVGVRAVANGILGITFANPTAATITPTASEAYTILALGSGMNAVSNIMLIEETLSLTASTNAVGSTAQGAVVTGLAVSDAIVGVTKPTAQSNFGIVQAFVSAAGTIGLTIANFAAATVTPTAGDVYGITINRPNPAAPLAVVSAPLTPVSVAANTTAEQQFATAALANLVASSVAWVNKPSATSGLGIVNVRVVAAGTLGITYANVTGAAIVPPAETYLVGNFQVPLGDAATEWVQSAELIEQSTDILSNSMRSALVSLGLMAGA